jgi:hypothetical protein
MTDQIDPHGSWKEEFERIAQDTVTPYYIDINVAFKRAHRLANHATKFVRDAATPFLSHARRELADDILRSVVVLTHAQLEDFLRTMGKTFLPTRDEKALNGVPLLGTTDSGRAEKFFLGRLARHRGKLIDDLIKESVEEYLGRVSFNNGTDIMNFLEQIGLKIREKTREQLPTIDAMTRRRHQIVHRADRIGGELQLVDPGEILNWVEVTRNFMQSLLWSIFLRHYPVNVLKEKFNLVSVDEETGTVSDAEPETDTDIKEPE